MPCEPKKKYKQDDIYISIPKTEKHHWNFVVGRAVEKMREQHDDTHCYYKNDHVTAEELGVGGDRDRSKSFLFSFVREPISHFLRSYHFDAAKGQV